MVAVAGVDANGGSFTGKLVEFPPEKTENGTNSDDSPSTIHSYITNHQEEEFREATGSARVRIELFHTATLNNTNCDTPLSLRLELHAPLPVCNPHYSHLLLIK